MCWLSHVPHEYLQAKASPASWKCSEEFFSNLIKSKDPLNIGYATVTHHHLVTYYALLHHIDQVIDIRA